ncbi:hypothetical protein D8674_001470 [Pyrus ussuriensis x Pyrus communis]|uniref:Uncharacterized protein n=1 Tax=Pyrus ussuriensis x Pyrus communis TaxID=2448454 RepID=A0A5N5FBQ2_9ROSA|nr:hypothetical protein D8674_001470 [Pyrus ussuriensis x Pyrus communis]
MLDSTLDLLTQAASNSLYVFCFCNLIIVMILVGSKPGSYFDQESEIPVSVVTSSYKNRNTNDHKQVEDGKCEQEEGSMIKSPIVFGQVVNPEVELAAAGDDKGSSDDHNESKECDSEDELRRRAEEFIEKAASNSVFIFCFCNLIIVIILVGSRPVSNNDERSIIRVTTAPSKSADDEQGTRAKQAWKEKNALMQVSELVSNEQNAAADDGEFSSTDGDSDDDETDTDDELRTRVEEFIEKVNKAWKAEVLTTSCVS